MLKRIGRRSAVAFSTLMLVAIAGAVALLVTGAATFAFVLLTVHTLAAFILGVMVWDQGVRTRHHLSRQHQSTVELLQALERHAELIPGTLEEVVRAHDQQLRQSLDKHEERIFRYLDAVDARAEVARMRSE